MGNVSYMTLVDSNDELIKGSSYVLDREGCIEIYKVNYNVGRQIDSQTGKTHSTRRHQPMTFVKKIDCASPALFKACTKGIRLPVARLDLYRTGEEGREEIYYTYTMSGVRVVSITPIIDSESSKQDMEAISISFEKIEVLYHDGNIAAQDTWDSR
jgi:type VI secretion system secreted protein Hcp